MNFFRPRFFLPAGIAALLACLCSCGRTAPPASAASAAAPTPGSVVTLRLATYNVRNYNSIDRTIDGVRKPDWPKPEAEKSALREVILAAHPDVLALEEMGANGELDELRRDLASAGLNYPYSALVRGPDPDRHVAVLSRVPLAAVHPHENIPFKYNNTEDTVRRGLLEVDIDTNGRRWELYVVHLKSRLTDVADDPQSAAEREGEARAVRDIVRKEQGLPGPALVAVVGDFNDARDSTTLKRFTDLNGQPLFKIAPTADSRGETWTSSYGREDEYDRSDYILFSPALAEFEQRRGGIADLPASLAASDHRLVWVDLSFPSN
jgi:endonuclease/exonuclease/phosphatase family metal-dependent hydrolase